MKLTDMTQGIVDAFLKRGHPKLALLSLVVIRSSQVASVALLSLAGHSGVLSALRALGHQ